jgi:hypothetical protein
MNPELIALDQLLAKHDWTYEYSDDHSAWKRGRQERDAINAEKRRLISEGVATAEELTVLMAKYGPKNT